MIEVRDMAASDLFEKAMGLATLQFKNRIAESKVLPYDPPPYDGWLSSRVDTWLVPLTLLCDIPNALLRWYVLGPPCRAAAAWDRWRWKRRAGIYTCPHCFTPHRELAIACPRCQTIQPALRLGPGELFRRSCAKCHLSYSLLGAHRKEPGRIVCRDEPGFLGCNRPLPPNVPWGLHPEVHMALAGVTTWRKLAVLTLILNGLNDAWSAWKGEPVGELAKLEFDALTEGHRSDPRGLSEETPTTPTALARSALWLVSSASGDRLLQIHNMASSWCESDDDLDSEAFHLAIDNCLIFVLEPDETDPTGHGVLPHAPLYARLFRAMERCLDGSHPVGATPSLRIAVVLPHPSGPLTSEETEARVHDIDPYLRGLIRQSTTGTVAFFGGPITTASSPSIPNNWVANLIEFILGDRQRRDQL